MNAADYYGLDELRRACAGFVQCCINVDTVCALLASAERYIQYKCTKSLVQKVKNQNAKFRQLLFLRLLNKSEYILTRVFEKCNNLFKDVVCNLRDVHVHMCCITLRCKGFRFRALHQLVKDL
jgi:hypothetical protein